MIDFPWPEAMSTRPNWEFRSPMIDPSAHKVASHHLHRRKSGGGRVQPCGAQPLCAGAALPGNLSPREEEGPAQKKLNRVTDVCIPENRSLPAR